MRRAKQNVGFIVLSMLMAACVYIGIFTLFSYRHFFGLGAPEPLPVRSVRAIQTSQIETITEPKTEIKTETFAEDLTAAVNETAWNLTLINKENPVSADYKGELVKLANGQLVDKRIYPALQEMFDAARSEGIYPEVVSGYRTAEEQKSLMKEKVASYKAKGCSAEEAEKMAETEVAIPGASEHQAGIAVDINSADSRSTNGEVYEWLAQNACKFGFILRYPAGKTDITGIGYEPWHYRYVGTFAATEISERKISLEEYLAEVF